MDGYGYGYGYGGAILALGFLLSQCLGLSPDGELLLALKKSVWSDPMGALDTWNASDRTPCYWRGVTCAPAPLGVDVVRVVASVNVPRWNLSGTIPPELGQLAHMHRLSLSGNRLTGALPPALFAAASLHTLLLSGNLFTGTLPGEDLARLTRLENLDLSDNLLTGNIPAVLAQCQSLRHLILARNHFSGTIPKEIGRLLDLRTLDLSENSLDGTIPASLGSLPTTLALNLSHNNLSGPVPQSGSLANRGPTTFLGNPNLCGKPLANPCQNDANHKPPLIPSLPTDGSPNISTGGGSSPIAWGSTSSPPNISLNRPDLSATTVAAIAVGDSLGVAIVALLFLYLYRKTTICQRNKSCPCISCSTKENSDTTTQLQRPWLYCFRSRKMGSSCDGNDSTESDQTSAANNQHKGTTKGEPELVPLDKAFSFHLEELLQASAYVLGKSGLGLVYKVVLGNGLPLAVRRLREAAPSQRGKEFEVEAQAIGHIRHPNVVKLRAYYWADEEKLLIYDYIPNGSLASTLHGIPYPLSPSGALPWLTRLKIAQGVAKGLAYLHECSPRKYVHGNIRSSKVLLDLSMNPYIADFGLSHLADIACNGVSQSITPPHVNMQPIQPLVLNTGDKDKAPIASFSSPSTSTSGTRVVDFHRKIIKPKTSGDFYYRAPECVNADSKPTQKCDVYSFGVILLEILTGRSPSFQVASFGVDLVSWIRRVVEEEKPLSHILDPSLLDDHTYLDKDITSVIQIALACTTNAPDQRPKMKFVSDSLDKVGPPPP